MFRKSLLAIITAASFVSIASGNLGAQYELVKVVTERQLLMYDMQAAYWPLLEVKNGKSTDLAKAGEASQTINDAIEKFVQLLPPGTAQGDVPGSRAKPEIWTEPDAFSAAVTNLKTAASNLTKAAREGNLDAFNLQFDAMAQACIGCHNFKPSKGGKFRVSE